MFMQKKPIIFHKEEIKYLDTSLPTQIECYNHFPFHLFNEECHTWKMIATGPA